MAGKRQSGGRSVELKAMPERSPVKCPSCLSKAKKRFNHPIGREIYHCTMGPCDFFFGWVLGFLNEKPAKGVKDTAMIAIPLTSAGKQQRDKAVEWPNPAILPTPKKDKEDKQDVK